MKKSSGAVPEPEVPTGLRRYLFFTAALTGGVIMVVEILGAKMLAPQLGSSHFVWTAQIAVTLVALATGYSLGGRLVDRSPRLGRLYGCLLLAAVALSVAVAIARPVARWCLGFDLAAGSVMASALLFFLPLALLAVVGPFVVRVLSSSVTGVGGLMGRLTAVSTLGSVGGTVLVGYCLIPFLPNSVTLYVTSLGLMLGCGVYFVRWGRRASPLAPIGLAMALGAGAGYFGVRADRATHARGEELFWGNSNFGLMQVMESADRGRRFYLNDYLTQNTYDPVARQSTSLFTYMLHGLARAYVTNIEDVLCIGLGVGVVPMQFAREGARVDVVEINPAVVPVAVKYFDLEPGRLNLTIGDGRFFLNRCRKRYDAVVLDAFLGESTPSHLMTREAFGEMRRALKPGGALILNSIGNFAKDRDFSTASLHRTLNAVFAGVRVHWPEGGNVLFVASDRAELKFVRAPDLQSVHPSVIGSVERGFAHVVETVPGRGRVLTDDFNPVDFYDAKNREEFRRRMAMAMAP